MTQFEIIETIILGIVCLALIIFYTVKAVKNDWLKELTDTIHKAIKEAEETKAKGEDKKKYVLDKVIDKCVELGIPYYAIEKLVKKLIDNIIKNYNVIAK